MNLERFHTIINAIRDDLIQTKSVALVQQLHGALQTQVSQPQQQAYQQKVSEARHELGTKLTNAASNDFSPTWIQVIEEMGVQNLLGARLSVRIDDVFLANQITPATALIEIEKIANAIATLESSVDGIVDGFEYLDVTRESLEPGEAEVGVLIPRLAVHNKLSEFGSEVTELDRILGAFSELVTGSRPSFSIRTISSSDLTLFVDAAPEICACVAVAVERIVALYKNLLDIRKSKQDLVTKGVPEEHLSSIGEFADKSMAEGIEILLEELIDAYRKDSSDTGRNNELDIELRRALKKIANRVDKGYNFEVRAASLPEPADIANDEYQLDRQHLETIFKKLEEMQFLELRGAEILALPEDKASNTVKRVLRKKTSKKKVAKKVSKKKGARKRKKS